eukprot:212566_1
MNVKRMRQYKHNFKNTPCAIPDKPNVIKALLKQTISLDHILRAIKVYEHNYGKNYNFTAISEIAVRLQKKDSRKYDQQAFNEREEEKRNTTKYLIDDMKHRGASLSMSVSSNANIEPIVMESQPYHRPKHKKPQLLRRHTDHKHDRKYKLKQHKLRKSISNEHIKAKENTIFTEFVPFMSASEMSKLRLFDNIDHRDFVGRFSPATIIEIDRTDQYNVKLHYEGYPDDKYDIWCNYKNEPFRFAKYRSISRRFQCTNHRTEKDAKLELRKEEFKIGDFVLIHPLYTIFAGQWYKGIINKFDRKSDQIQIAYKPFQENDNCNDFVLYWSHIDNILELQPYPVATVPSVRPQALIKHDGSDNIITKKKKEKESFSEWNTQQVIEWLNTIENGRFNDEIFDHFKQQIEVIQLKGYELNTLNETALKFAGLLNTYDRKLIINNILNLVNKNSGFTYDQCTTTATPFRKGTRDKKQSMDGTAT